MKSQHITFVGVVALGAALGAAETDSITTRDGITYTNAVIQRADPNGLVIEYAPRPGSVGIAKLKFANLPDELRRRYNYNATDALIFEQNHAAGIARRQEQIERGEIEKQRQYDVLVQKRAEKDAALEAKMQEAAAMAAAQMDMGGWYGGYSGAGDWYGAGDRRFRFNSRGSLNPHGHGKFGPHSPDVDGKDFSSGVGLSGLGTGWGDSGHWGPLPSPASRGPSHSGAFRNPAARGNPAASSFSARSR
jgi:hypothetical protein